MSHDITLRYGLKGQPWKRLLVTIECRCLSHCIMIGTRLAQFTIKAHLGSGGMGDVYEATDSKLGRSVAIKLLPDAFARDAERVVRFEREARVLAALNHPNIAGIHGLERVDGRTFLVMEYIPGETLAERVKRGPIPIGEALGIARQICEGLEVAHEKGIVHRDLKPANVKITPDGRVKTLDFGIAKAIESRASGGSNDADSPTLTPPTLMTGAGVLLGTAAYMSPEQARGQDVDKRSDIWAFGCVLYEMLTGERPFAGATTTETLAAVLERQVDWTKLPSSTPATIRTLLRRTLEKDPRRRLHDIADVRIEFDEVERSPDPVPAGKPRSWIPWAIALGAVAIAAVVAAWAITTRAGPVSSSPPPEVSRTVIVPAAPVPSQGEGGLALSPDGRLLAYVAEHDGVRQLYLRHLDHFESAPIAGTEDADDPAFSPDGRWLAFAAAGKLEKVAVDGGRPVPVCDFSVGHGIYWASDDEIVFGNGLVRGVQRVPASGGPPTPMTTLQPGELEQNYPVVLPGGRAILFLSLTDADGPRPINRHIIAYSLETGERREVATGAAAAYLDHRLLYVQGDELLAVSFNSERLATAGVPSLVLQSIRLSELGLPQIAYSRTGSLAYVPGNIDEHQASLVWVNRDGSEELTNVRDLSMDMPRLSPDLSRVTVTLNATEPGRTGADAWWFDLARGQRTRVTFDVSTQFSLWAPAGTRIAYNSSRSGQAQIYIKDLGEDTDQRVPTNPNTHFPLSWSPDGRFLAAVSVSPETANDIWVYDLQDPSASRAFIATPFREGAPTFSPDGRWIAYTSLKSGRSEIYMSPFPGPGEEITISTNGGNEPLFARKAGELFYRQGDAMMVVDVALSPKVTVSAPRRLFADPYAHSSAAWPDYDVTPDGQRVLMVKRRPIEPAMRINMIFNWLQELERLAPTN
jgi:eukaryotic-like serine/threonine-protein kinase